MYLLSVAPYCNFTSFFWMLNNKNYIYHEGLCPFGWIYLNSKCYYNLRSAQNFKNSQDMCKVRCFREMEEGKFFFNEFFNFTIQPGFQKKRSTNSTGCHPSYVQFNGLIVTWQER